MLAIWHALMFVHAGLLRNSPAPPGLVLREGEDVISAVTAHCLQVGCGGADAVGMAGLGELRRHIADPRVARMLEMSDWTVRNETARMVAHVDAFLDGRVPAPRRGCPSTAGATDPTAAAEPQLLAAACPISASDYALANGSLDPAAWVELGKRLFVGDHVQLATAALVRALLLRPENVTLALEAAGFVATAAHVDGRARAAEFYYGCVEAMVDTASAEGRAARWGLRVKRAQLVPPVVHARSTDDAQRWHGAVLRKLRELQRRASAPEAQSDMKPGTDAAAAAAAAGAGRTPGHLPLLPSPYDHVGLTLFNLAHYGENDVEVMQNMGAAYDLLCPDLRALLCPACIAAASAQASEAHEAEVAATQAAAGDANTRGNWTAQPSPAPPPPPRCARPRVIRVGFVSPYLSDHSIGRMLVATLSMLAERHGRPEPRRRHGRLRWRSLGCWADMIEQRAMPALEGTRSWVNGPYQHRSDAIRRCAAAAEAVHGEGAVFALQDDGYCTGAPSGKLGFSRYGRSDACAATGKGGPWANEVYRLEQAEREEGGGEEEEMACSARDGAGSGRDCDGTAVEGRCVPPALPLLELHVFHVHGGEADDAVQRAINGSAHFAHLLPLEDPAAARVALGAAAMDVLVYCDIGLDPFPYFLAAARLAPVQAAWWGHPSTTGLATVDWFVSHTAAEPFDAENHYTERLWRLAHLNTAEFEQQPRQRRQPSHYAAAPGGVAATPASSGFDWLEGPEHSLQPLGSATGLGVPLGAPLFFVFGRLFKLHPRFDDAVCTLLRTVPTAFVVLVAERNTVWSAALHARLVERLTSEGEGLAGRVRLTHYWNFVSSLQGATAVLDSFPYGGCLTVLEALSVGVPVVTLAGSSLRGRLGAAILWQMADGVAAAGHVAEAATLRALVAADEEEYAATASRLATDPPFRERCAAAVELGYGGGFHRNAAAADDWADFIRHAAADASTLRRQQGLTQDQLLRRAQGAAAPVPPISISVLGGGASGNGGGSGGSATLTQGSDFAIRVEMKGAEGLAQPWQSLCVRPGGGRHKTYGCVRAEALRWDGTAALLHASGFDAGEHTVAAALVDKWGRAVATATPLRLFVGEGSGDSGGGGSAGDSAGRGVGGEWRVGERVALLVETRRHPLLGAVVGTVCAALGPAWPIQIFHGPDNGAWLAALPRLRKLREAGFAITLVALDARLGDPLPLDTQARYSFLLASASFWRRVTGERVLLFQTDAVLCGPAHPERPRIEDFDAFDYVGAPWAIGLASGGQRGHPVCAEFAPERCVGNGGLSLRRRSLMVRVCEAFVCNRLEDQFFALHAPMVGGALPDEATALRFSVEGVYDGQTVPFGVHAPHKHLSGEQLFELLRRCPEAKLLLGFEVGFNIERINSTRLADASDPPLPRRVVHI